MLNLHSLRTFLSDLRAAFRPAPADDLCALAEAVGVMADAVPAVDWSRVPEPTPLADAALDFLRTSLAALDAMDTVEDFLWLTGEDA